MVVGVILTPAEIAELTQRKQRAVALSERDEWLRHYLAQSLRMVEIDRAMQFSGRRPSVVIQDLLKKGAPILRNATLRRTGNQIAYTYPIKRLVAVVRAWGLEVTQCGPRHWVPAEVEASAESARAKEILRLTEDLRKAQDLAFLYEEKADKAQLAFSIEKRRFEYEVAERVRAECFERTISPDDIQNILALMMTAHELRPAPGVYWLLSAVGTVVYVGQSKNCISRMVGHKDKEFVSARMIRIDDDRHRSDIERALIRSMRPGLNIMSVPKLAVQT